MTHSPVGLYSSALNHTNHERDHAGMTSQDLQKRVFERPKGAYLHGASPDLFYCMNRIHPDGAPIENPFLDDGNPYQSNTTKAHLSVTKTDGRRPTSAGNSRGSPSGGYPSPDRQSVSSSGNDSARCRLGHKFGGAAPAGLRQNSKREEVPEWPRNWGRVQSMTRSFEKASVGEMVRNSDLAGTKVGHRPTSDAVSHPSGSDRGSRGSGSRGSGRPEARPSPGTTRRPRR